MTARTLVIGLGGIGMRYDLDLPPDEHVYTHARAIARHPGFELVGGVDPDAGRRERFTSVYERPSFATASEGLERSRPDVVVVASPTESHRSVLDQALKLSQPRAVLCEKPLSETVDAAAAMVEACERRGVQLFVNFARRADPAVVEIKRRIDSGEIATPLKGVIWYSKGFFHNGSHFFNLAEHWFGPMRDAQILDPGRAWAASDPEPDVRVVFERGAVLFLAAWEERFSHYSFELLSPSGRLNYLRRGELVEWRSTAPDPYFKGYTYLSATAEQLASGASRSQWHVFEQLDAAMKGDSFSLCTGAEALETMKSMHHVIQRG